MVGNLIHINTMFFKNLFDAHHLEARGTIRIS